MEINKIELENGKEYMIIDNVINGPDKYLILTSMENEDDICIRKVINKEGKDYLKKLDNKDEFQKVIMLLSAKYKNEEGKNE